MRTQSKRTFMFLKKIISGVAIFIFAHGINGFAQQDEISDEDLKLLKI